MRLTLAFILTFCFSLTFGQTTKCNCKKFENRNLNLNCDLSYSDNGNKFNIEMLEKWEDTSKCNKIKSLYFTDFDTIPAEFKRFKNVEKLRIVGINKTNIFGLHYFPKLKELILEEMRLEISDKDTWLKNLEKLTTNKTKLIGIKSFKKFNKLKEIKMSFSGFDNFPNDFSSLKLLKYISFGGHTFGQLNLNEINFKEHPKLEYFEVECWFDKVIGVPTGLNKNICTKINYEGITKQIKSKLNEYTCH